jgi:glycerophosphoryl diester phosphodiesterase
MALLVLGGCRAPRNGSLPWPAWDKEGHRGCRGLMPENTILAMLRAVDLGVNTLELDVVITADGKVICSHEPFFNHEITTKHDGTFVDASEERSLNIYKMTYDQVKTYDVGLKPHPRFPEQEKIRAYKPLLEELIDDVESYIKLREHKRIWYNIETKTQPQTDNLYHPTPELFVETLMDVLQRKKVTGRVVIQSFDYRTLRYLHQKYPKMKTSALVEEFDHRNLEAHIAELGFTSDVYSPHYSLVTPELVKQCHVKKIRLVAWTVNDPIMMKKLKEMGVDGIISDYPDRFSKLNGK